MLAYTAVDGLRAISRDFDLHWQPEIHDGLAASGRDWRDGLRTGQRIGQQALGAFLALLPLGVTAWLR
jgi:hypothetical protein